MSRWRKAVKIAALTGVVAVGGGAFVLTKKMFVDRHAIVSLHLKSAWFIQFLCAPKDKELKLIIWIFQRTDSHVQLQLQHINQRKKLLPLLTRQEHLKALKENEYDELVIGSGATGKFLA